MLEFMAGAAFYNSFKPWSLLTSAQRTEGVGNPEANLGCCLRFRCQCGVGNIGNHKAST